MRIENLDGFIQRCGVARPNLGLVEVEMHAAQHQFLMMWRRRDWSWWWRWGSGCYHGRRRWWPDHRIAQFMTESGADNRADRTPSSHSCSEFVGTRMSVAGIQIGDANSRSDTCHPADDRACKSTLA